jgi:hypothetical protein
MGLLYCLLRIGLRLKGKALQVQEKFRGGGYLISAMIMAVSEAGSPLKN